jgi:hypothetical protein
MRIHTQNYVLEHMCVCTSVHVSTHTFNGIHSNKNQNIKDASNYYANLNMWKMRREWNNGRDGMLYLLFVQEKLIFVM